MHSSAIKTKVLYLKKYVKTFLLECNKMDIVKDTKYKIRNHAFLIIVNLPNLFAQSVAIPTNNVA